MTWQAAAFREYFLRVVGKESSAASYATRLRKIDAFVDGLDEKIEQVGHTGIIEWAKTQTGGPFEDYPSNLRTALKRYVTFLIESVDPEPRLIDPSLSVEMETIDEVEATLFQYERELQAAVRRQLGSLEPGLREADGGTERSVATGRIDILAETDHHFVVIELKAGRCPAGALEQALGYTTDIENETGRAARTVLVAAEFPERVRSAARRILGLRLVTYTLNLKFADEPTYGGS